MDPPRPPVQLQLPLVDDVSIRNTCSDLACRIDTEGSYYKRSLAKYTFLEFFAGAGLVRAGLEPDWRCLWANDIDTSKQRIYEANFGKGDFHPGDVADVKPGELPAADMAWASFPCQDLSLASWQRGMSAERSGTFWPFWSLMRDRFDAGKRLPIIVLENVTGLLYGDNFTGLCDALAALNMRFGAMVLDARWFLPQSRARVFIVAVDPTVNIDRFIEPLPSGRHVSRALMAAWRRLPSSVADRWLWWKFNPVSAEPIRLVDDLIDLEPEGVEWHSKSETQRLLGMMSEVNRAKIDEAAATGERRVGFLYKRIREDKQRAEVRFDGLAGCLRTPGGGSSRQTVIVVDGEVVRSRLLSPREAARLMGLPDTFKLPGTYNEAYKAMGDGVAVAVIEALRQQLLTPLAKAVSVARRRKNRPAINHVAHHDTFRSGAEDRAAKWVGSGQPAT